jgi:hypothetical protein
VAGIADQEDAVAGLGLGVRLLLDPVHDELLGPVHRTLGASMKQTMGNGTNIG